MVEIFGALLLCAIQSRNFGNNSVNFRRAAKAPRSEVHRWRVDMSLNRYRSFLGFCLMTESFVFSQLMETHMSLGNLMFQFQFLNLHLEDMECAPCLQNAGFFFIVVPRAALLWGKVRWGRMHAAFVTWIIAPNTWLPCPRLDRFTFFALMM